MTVIVVFARLPVPGKAKTRLAASVGPGAAAKFYKLCASAVFCQAARCPSADAMVYCASADDVPGMQEWLQRNGTPLPVAAQLPSADLGQRLLSALTAAATGQQAPTAACPAASEQQDQQKQQQQQHHAALVIGTDIPDLSSSILAAAAAALVGGLFDVVLGPAHDGGFYLLGLSRLALLRPEVQAGGLFAGVEWSTGTVLQRTLAAAQQLGLRVAPLPTLPELRDIDTLQDLQDWWQQRQQQQQQEQQQQQQQQQGEKQQQERQKEPGQLHQQGVQKGCAGVVPRAGDLPGQQFQQLCSFVGELCSSSSSSGRSGVPPN